MADGTRLAARIWMPAGAEHEACPAILEYIPYRKNDFTAARDNSLHAHFARLGEISYGEYPDNITGPLGFDAIVKAYGLKRMKVRPLNIGLRYPALATGRVQAADVFTTDPQLRHHDFTILDDDKHVFGFQNVAPVVRQKIVERYGARLTEPLDLVDALLTEPAMQALNEAVAIKRLSPTEVARRFLRANDLT
jgi:osmoprotectant transport system substrate-binding protein